MHCAIAKLGVCVTTCFFLLATPATVLAQQGTLLSPYAEALQQQSAQTGGLVTCLAGDECNFCDLGQMINNIINWLFGFLTVVAVLVFAAAGFKLVTSGGDTTARDWAKARFTYVIIGFLLMFASWLIVDTILRGLTGSDQGMSVWGSFDVENCGEQRDPRDAGYTQHGLNTPDHSYESDIESSVGGGPDDGLRGNSSVQLSGNLISVDGHMFDSAIAGNVRELADTYGLRISGGHRTRERNQQVNGSPTSHHLSGRAADFVGTMDQMRSAEAAADRAGAIETIIHDAGSGTHLHVAW